MMPILSSFVATEVVLSQSSVPPVTNKLHQVVFFRARKSLIKPSVYVMWSIWHLALWQRGFPPKLAWNDHTFSHKRRIVISKYKASLQPQKTLLGHHDIYKHKTDMKTTHGTISIVYIQVCSIGESFLLWCIHLTYIMACILGKYF